MSTDDLVDTNIRVWDSSYMAIMDLIEVAQAPESSEKELPDKELIEACDRVVDSIFQTVDSEYGPKGHRPLEFHNRSHAQAVVRRTETILETIQAVKPELVSEKDLALARVAAAGHDVIQSGLSRPDNTKGSLQETLQRRVGYNERESGFEVAGRLDQLLEEKFSQRDGKVIEDAINGTVPEWVNQLGTVTQPNVTEESSIVTFAVARADLGTAGMDGPDAFRVDGNSEFRETKIGISRAIKSYKDANPEEPLLDRNKDYISAQIRGWLLSQISFAQGRQISLYSELEVLNDPELEGVLKEKVFNKFEETINDAKARFARAQTMNFDQLIQEVGY